MHFHSRGSESARARERERASERERERERERGDGAKLDRHTPIRKRPGARWCKVSRICGVGSFLQRPRLRACCPMQPRTNTPSINCPFLRPLAPLSQAPRSQSRRFVCVMCPGLLGANGLSRPAFGGRGRCARACAPARLCARWCMC